MPYGRGFKRRTTRPRRYGRRIMRRKTTKFPRTKKTTKTYVAKNAYSISRLSRAVRKLRRSQYGSTQLNVCRSTNVRVSSIDAVYADHYFQLNVEQGLAFDVRDFSKRSGVSGDLGYNQGCHIWQRYVNAPGGLASTVNVGCFDNLFKGDPTRFWTCNSDVVDTGKYLINYNKLQIQFRVMSWSAALNKWEFPSNSPGFGPTYIDIRLISHRPEAIRKWSTSDNKGLMPKALSELGFGLADEQNAINPYYFKTWSHKRIMIDSRDLQTSLTKNISMFLKPKGVNYQGRTLPESPGDDITDIGPVPENPWGTFNISYTQPLWLLVSTSNPQPPLPTPDGHLTVGMRIVSTRSWRDANGSARL